MNNTSLIVSAASKSKTLNALVAKLARISPTDAPFSETFSVYDKEIVLTFSPDVKPTYPVSLKTEGATLASNVALLSRKLPKFFAAILPAGASLPVFAEPVKPVKKKKVPAATPATPVVEEEPIHTCEERPKFRKLAQGVTPAPFVEPAAGGITVNAPLPDKIKKIKEAAARVKANKAKSA